MKKVSEDVDITIVIEKEFRKCKSELCSIDCKTVKKNKVEILELHCSVCKQTKELEIVEDKR